MADTTREITANLNIGFGSQGLKPMTALIESLVKTENVWDRLHKKVIVASNQAIELSRGTATGTRPSGIPPLAHPIGHPYYWGMPGAPGMMPGQPQAPALKPYLGGAAPAARQDETLRILQNLQMGGFAGRMGKYQNIGQGLEAVGFSRGGAALGRAAPFLAAAEAGGDFAKTAITLGHDPYLTTGQMGRQLMGQMPGGETLRSWIDAISGRAAGMELAAIGGAKQSATISAESGLQRQIGQFMPAQARKEELAQQLREAKPILMGSVDRTTAVGERTFRETSRLLPLRRELARADREAAAASWERVNAERETMKLDVQLVNIRKQQAALQEKINRDQGSGVDRQNMLVEMAGINQRYQATLANRQAAQDTLIGAKNREAEARGQSLLRRADIREAEAANLEERAATAASSARGLGAMTPVDRAFAVQSLKALQQYGPDSIPPEMLAQALSIAPQTAGKIVESRGANTPEFRELARIAPADFAGDPEKLRQDAQKARDEAEEFRIKAQQDVTAAAAEAGRDFGKFLTTIMKELIRTAKLEIDNQVRIGKGQQ